ncbi:hypothetical protein M3152_10245 [Sporosarcina luteola]|uniref:hypothetical protein n=1 Tax=Bacillales TaxID=1385 RepID=UPI00203FA318|nr:MULTISPECIES: hypothetical protein [Bacillales]MCM3638106.1 hypothetical protein [Sporosarcina luteola]
METEKQMSLKDWILTLVLVCLPIVGLVMLIIWATDKQDPRNTFSKAYLIVMGSIFALILLMYIFIFIFILFIGIMAS